MSGRLVIACLLLAGSVVDCSPAAAQTSLRWKFAKGQSFTVDGTQQIEVETRIKNKPSRAYLEVAMKLAWQVDEVDDEGVATLTQSFTRLAIKTTAPEAEPIVYDSDANTRPTGAAKAIAAGIRPLVGAKFTVRMTPRGDVVEVQLPKETEEALATLPDDHQLKQVLSAEGLQKLFRLGGGLLPEKEVSSGDSWPADATTDTPYGKLVQEGKFTYAGEETVLGRALQKLELSAMARLEPKADAPVNLRSLEQTKSGTILVDAEAGYVARAETRVTSTSVRPFRDQPIQIKVTAVTELSLEPK